MRRISCFLFLLIILGFSSSCDRNIQGNRGGKDAADFSHANSSINLYGNFNEGQLLFYYYRDLLNHEVKNYSIIKSDTSISHDLAARIPMEINFNRGPHVVKYILFPGDSINVITKRYNHYHLRSAYNIRQNELRYQFVNGPKIDVNMHFSKDNEYGFNRKDLLQQYTYWTTKTKAALSEKLISEDFADYHQIILKSKLITNLLYPIYVPNQEKIVEEIDDALIKEHLVLDEKYLGLTSYRSALWHYLKFQTLKKDKEITPNLMASTAASFFKGEIRDFMLAQILREQQEKGNLLAWTNEYD